jgi:hypothetical protein
VSSALRRYIAQVKVVRMAVVLSARRRTSAGSTCSSPRGPSGSRTVFRRVRSERRQSWNEVPTFSANMSVVVLTARSSAGMGVAL